MVDTKLVEEEELEECSAWVDGLGCGLVKKSFNHVGGARALEDL